MATIRPFYGIRPSREKAAKIAALPYDVYNTEEAREEIRRHPDSFLRIDRPETQFPEGHDMYAGEVYQKAADLLQDMIACGDYICESAPAIYIYELTMNGRTQTGLTACASIDDYENNVIRKHENTRPEKELDRIRHIDACSAQTGPIFLAYRQDPVIRAITEKHKQKEPLYDFLADDGIGHRVWIIDDPEDIGILTEAFAGIDHIYIADGHHRAASAVRVGQMRRAAHPGYTGTEEFNYFLSVLFPADQLSILDYNRVVKDLNGLTGKEFLQKIRQIFDVTVWNSPDVYPPEKGTFSMLLDGKWYCCMVREADRTDDPVKGLDVSYLQDLLLGPVLGIDDPRTDSRIDFVGGIRGLGELERRCRTDAAVAFAMYPTSIDELFAVADAGRLMPPKSTWFEPKIRSGLFIHSLF